MKRVLVLGSTGSIGTNAINIISYMPQDFILCGIQAHSSEDNLIKLAEKYNSVIEGHHKSYDGKTGYPESFSSIGDRMKIMVDIITIADCIDAATDTLGRNYTKSKTWLPALADELENDEKMRYNQEIVNIIKNDKETCDSISYITDEGRTDIYYDIYRKYISDAEEDNAIQIEQVLIK